MIRNGKPLRVLIVDDSARVRKAFSGLVETELTPVEVATAGNGALALERIAAGDFDLVLLDLSMPVMDGFTFLRVYRTRSQTPVLVVSALSDIENVERVMELGANAFMAKPADLAKNEESVREEFRLKLQKLLPRRTLLNFMAKGQSRPVKAQPQVEGEFPVVVIGSSSGGPPSLQYLLSGLPTRLDGAVIIAQHMPKGFMAGMVERLKRLFSLDIREAAHGNEVERGVIYFCPGGVHMEVTMKAGVPRFTALTPLDRDISPSVDRLFTSAAATFGQRLMGIVLTGMGKDGSLGVRSIKEAGGTVLAESDETAAIFGMPREAAATGCVDVVAPLTDLSIALTKKITSGKYQ